MEVRWRTQSDLVGEIAEQDRTGQDRTGQDRTDEQQAVLILFFPGTGAVSGDGGFR